MAQGGEHMDTFETEGLDCIAGRITFCKDHKIGEHDASLKPKVYLGHFNHEIPVAIKRYQKAGDDKELKCVTRDFQFLSSEKNRHPNLIRYYGKAEKPQFVYLATELCECSVAGLIARNEKLHILDHLNHKEILRQSAEAVKFLHGLGMIHRNLHPENFLIAQISDRDYLVKLTDFHSTKNWKDEPNKSGTRASDGWAAPDGLKSPTRTKESGNNSPKKKKTEDGTVQTEFSYPNSPKNPDEDPGTDVFILGCFFYYVLSGGKHPFGSILDRIGNINSNHYKVYEQNWDGSVTHKDKGDNVVYDVIWGVSLSGKKNPFGGPKENKEGYSPEWQNESLWWKVEAFNALDLIKNSMIRKRRNLVSMNQVLSHPYFNDHPSYKIYEDDESGKKPGLCIIVSQEKFYQEANDAPSMKQDADKLTQTFAGFGFHVLVYKNLTADQLTDWITPERLDEKLKEENDELEEYNSLVVCILSHGEKGTVLGVDGQSVIINQIKYAFNRVDCNSLKDKPKIFIILACQESNSQTSAQQRTPSAFLSKPTTAGTGHQVLEKKSWAEDAQPPLIHHLTLMSTIEEFKAYGKPDGSGSYFIQTLCDQLKSEYDRVQSAEHEKKTRDLLQLFHSEVVPRVARETIRIGDMQTPESRSTLLRTIRFRRWNKNCLAPKGYDMASGDNEKFFQRCRDDETKKALLYELSTIQLLPDGSALLLDELKKIAEKFGVEIN